jgi:hypothetical protein
LEPNATRTLGARKAKDDGRPHRTSREAIDSLFPSERSEAAPKPGGARTPSELKNPFAPP